MADADAVLPFTWRELSDGSLILDDKAGGCHPANLYERRLIAALIAETERAERLHEALRQIYVQTHGLRGTCQMCDSGWRDGVEKHMASCLAAPLSKETT